MVRRTMINSKKKKKKEMELMCVVSLPQPPALVGIRYASRYSTKNPQFGCTRAQPLDIIYISTVSFFPCTNPKGHA
jgi:hypothetical protein